MRRWAVWGRSAASTSTLGGAACFHPGHAGGARTKAHLAPGVRGYCGQRWQGPPEAVAGGRQLFQHAKAQEGPAGMAPCARFDALALVLRKQITVALAPIKKMKPAAAAASAAQPLQELERERRL
eukprot:10981239-Alexandrium_andersonii.AAC.1